MGQKHCRKASKEEHENNTISIINEDVVREQLSKQNKSKLVEMCRKNKLSCTGSKYFIIERLIQHFNNYNLNLIHSYIDSSPINNNNQNVVEEAPKIKTCISPNDETFPSNGGSLQINTVHIDYDQLLNDNAYTYVYQKQFNDEKNTTTEEDEKLLQYTSKHPDSLHVNKRNAAVENVKISSFMIIQLHKDLKLNLFTKSADLADTLMGKISNHIYRMRYPSKEVPQMKYCKGCAKCDDILYLNLSKPKRKLSQMFMVNVFQTHETDDRYLNRPKRHIFNVNINDTFSDLANQISHMHKVPRYVILFFQQIGGGILSPYHENTKVCRYVRNNQVIQCYITQDYNLEYSLYRIQKENIKLIRCHFRHIKPALGDTNSYTFGLPFLMTITSKHTIFDIYTMLYEHLYHILGSSFMDAAPQIKRKKVIVSDNLNAFGEYEDWYWNTLNDQDTLQYWKWIFRSNNRVFALRVLPHKHYRFRDPAQAQWPDAMDPVLDDTYALKNFSEEFKDAIIDEMECHIAIEWHSEVVTDSLQRTLSTIYVSKQYQHWKYELGHLKKDIFSNNILCLYDYIENHRLNIINGNYLYLNAHTKENRCEKHGDLNEKLRTFKFTPYPSIMCFRLQFENDYKLNATVDYPIEYKLDLLKYNRSEDIQRKNALLLHGFIREIQDKLCSNFKYMDSECLVSLCMNYCDPYCTQTMYDLYAVLYPSCDESNADDEYGIFFKIQEQWFRFNEFEINMVEKEDLLFAGTPVVLFYHKVEKTAS